MPLTTAQLTTLKADIAANNTTIPAGIPDAGSFVGTAIKNIPVGNTDGAYAIASWYRQTASGPFYVLRTDVDVAEIFDQVNWANYTPADAPDNTVTWSNRSLACQGKQFNLQLLTQGRTVFNASKVTLRAGLNDCTTNLPSGASGASQSGGWANILNILRRAATNIEKLFAVQTSGVGTNSGNALGATTNPALMNFEGAITYQDILNAWNS